MTDEDGDARLCEAIIAEIEAAFDGVEREDGVTLHEADVIDEYGSPEERQAARLEDAETRWQDVPDTDIENYDWVLSFFDAKGFRYYIPAFMTWTLRHYRTTDSLSSDTTIYTLNGLEDRFKLLTRSQRRAICRFLRYFAEEAGEFIEDQARVALEKGWGQYC
jgi:hypothetical protein